MRNHVTQISPVYNKYNYIQRHKTFLVAATMNLVLNVKVIDIKADVVTTTVSNFGVVYS